MLKLTLLFVIGSAEVLSDKNIRGKLFLYVLRRVTRLNIFDKSSNGGVSEILFMIIVDLEFGILLYIHLSSLVESSTHFCTGT